MHRLFHLTLLFTLLSLSLASASSTHNVVAAGVRHRMIKKRQAGKPETASGSGLLGSSGLGVANAVPNPNEETTAGGSSTGAGTAAGAATAASSATGAGAGAAATSGAGAGTGTPAAAATNTPATPPGLGGGGIVGSIISGVLGGGNTATPNATETKTTATSTSATSTTATSTTPSATPTTPTTTAKDTAASQTPASTSVDSNGSTVFVYSTVPAQASQTADPDEKKSKGGVTKVGTKTIIILAAIGASIGAVGIIWTIIRKWKFRPSSSFDERLQPIDWQPTNDAAPGAAAAGGGPRDISEKALERNSSTRSHGSFTSGNGHGQRGGSQDHLTADIPPHDFTAGAAHLAPVGGYADLQRGPSPQPYDYDYTRAASPYQVPPPPPHAQYEQYEYTINTQDAGLPNPYAGAGAGGTGAPQMQQYYGHGGNAAAYQGYEHRGY